MFTMTTKIVALLSAAGTAILIGGLAYGLHTIAMDRAADKARDDLAAQKSALLLDCSSDKSITGRADNAIYQNHDLIDSVLNDRLRDASAARCVPVTGDPGGSAKTATGGDVHAPAGRSVGVSRAELYRITADADKVKSDLVECRRFLTETWKAKGQ